MPTATLEKCTVCSETSKKHSLESIGHFHSWKQPKCPSTDEWIKKMWDTYTMEYYSAIKKNEIMPFAATWMDLDIIILRK